VRTCPKCGSEISPTAKFCPECGEQVAAPASDAARSPSPETYTPKHLAEKILTSKAALEGERKQVTVLFADLKGSMELLADRDPEEAREILDPVLERMMEAVHRYEGTVNQVMGDGIMALFGAPIGHEDHAVRACYAALGIQDSLKEYAEEVRRSHGAVVQVRVGLNSGEVVVRSIGSDLRMDYTAVGQTTHLAARMEQLAAPGAIRLTARTLQLAEGFVEVTPLGPVPIKGLLEPIEVFELVGASTARTRFEAAERRGLTRFVGRSTELEQLRDVLDRASLGRGQVVAVVGEPGVGKSRLFYQFTRSRRLQGLLVLEAAPVSHAKGTTYFPVIELLRRYFGINARDDVRKMVERVTGKLMSLDHALVPTLPAFLSLLDVAVENSEWARLDPTQRRRQTLEALKRLLVRESQVQPLLLVVEDLHWIDSETQAWLDLLVDSLPMSQMLLLVNYRPEYTHGWGNKTYYQQVRLDALPATSAQELLDALFGTDPALAHLRRLLIERTQGNPFFLEESVRVLVETGALKGERGAYQRAGPIQNLQLPATVQAILAARIDRLTPDDKRLLQAAAVAGKDVPLALLQAVAEEPEESVRQSLARLQTAEFLYEARFFPELEYTFKHALTHEVAYGSLLEERRRTLHARIIEAVERLYPDRLAERVKTLATHAVRGKVWPKALHYSLQAAAKDFYRRAYREASAAYEQALESLGHLPPDHDATMLAVDLRVILANVSLNMAQYQRGVALLGEAEALARRLDDPAPLRSVLASISRARRVLGDSDGAIAAAREAVAMANASGDAVNQARASYRLGQAFDMIGEFRTAAKLFRETVNSFALYAPDPLPGPIQLEELAQQKVLVNDNLLTRRRRTLSGTNGRGSDRSDPSLFLRISFLSDSHAWLARVMAALGEFDEGRRHGEEAIRLAGLVQGGTSPITAHGSLGHLHLVQGDVKAAIAILEPGLALCRATDDMDWGLNIAGALGEAYARAGRLAEGVALLERAFKDAVERGALGFMGELAQRLVTVYLLTTRLDEARHHARRALDIARQQKARGQEAVALFTLSEVQAHTDSPEMQQAQTTYREALALAKPRGMCPLVAHCYFGLGKLYRRTDMCEQAQEHIVISTTMYREMAMTYWLERAAAEMRQLG
jgi:predicted ATPase/class 3 adenylate cyclase